MVMPLGSDDVLNGTNTSTDDTQLATGDGLFYGFLCFASSSGVVGIHEGTSAAGTQLGGGPITAGQVYMFGGKAQPFKGGLFFNLVSGTATIRALFRN